MRQFAPLQKITASGLLIVLILPLTILLGTFSVQAEEIQNPIEAKEFKDVITGIVRFANTLLAPLSTIMVLIAGFLYMTGGGNPEKIKTAHKVLIWALVGIGIVLLSYGAEAIIRSVLGV